MYLAEINRDTGEIRFHLKRLSEIDLKKTEEAPKRICQLFEALGSVHAANILHRDIKIDNLMIDTENDTLKIIDFGLAFLDPPKVMRYEEDAYTVGYRAPELLLNAKTYDTEKAEVWAAGACAANLMLGNKYLFTGTTLFSSLARILGALPIAPQLADITPGWHYFYEQWVGGKWSFPPLLQIIDERFGPVACDFMSKALDTNPETRATFAQLLAHPFICNEARISTLAPTEVVSSTVHIRSDILTMCKYRTQASATVRAELLCQNYADSMNETVSISTTVGACAVSGIMCDDFLPLGRMVIPNKFLTVPACNEILKMLSKDGAVDILTYKIV